MGIERVTAGYWRRTSRVSSYEGSWEGDGGGSVERLAEVGERRLLLGRGQVEREGGNRR